MRQCLSTPGTSFPSRRHQLRQRPPSKLNANPEALRRPTNAAMQPPFQRAATPFGPRPPCRQHRSVSRSCSSSSSSIDSSTVTAP